MNSLIDAYLANLFIQTEIFISDQKVELISTI